ncbi:hypothetical protein SAMN04515674_103234 [Pseudarcicella hirudinis]|uniref:Uncharacterized protein n=1 Tax=Pseudarcicella hirudinis TaxID=1079859 RepID=A0A1I5QJH7_9BACT|nr:hypothetical protein [Pseudarcicella hirudinis]SFP46448.1 hypothetical protein SAMN04515674_103234 [Pseudarcicella hirudinis]
MKISRNPLILLSLFIVLVVSIMSYSRNANNKNENKGVFSGKISFDDSTGHRILSRDVHVQRINDRGKPVIILTATNSTSSETVYIKLYNASSTGTHFIPGANPIPNIGNLIENLNNYRDPRNFFQTTLPNREGVQNGVGRVNITKLTQDEIEGELIIIANNNEGRQALLESAKFKARF